MGRKVVASVWKMVRRPGCLALLRLVLRTQARSGKKKTAEDEDEDDYEHDLNS